MIKTKINGKYELILPEHRAARTQWETGWEVKRIDSMINHLKEGDIVFDIGAEEGDISGLLAKKVGKTGGIVLFEPNPKVWANIRAIWNANKLKKPLAVYMGFASDITEENPGKSDIKKETKDGWPIHAYGEIIGNHGFRHLSQETDTTPQIKIDDFCERNNIYPDLITMDVEGSEFRVLKGAEKVLKKYRPIVYVSIHVDFMKEMYHAEPEDIHKFMESLGYKGFHLATDHEEHWMFKKVGFSTIGRTSNENFQ